MQETDGVRAWLHGISSTGRSAKKINWSRESWCKGKRESRVVSSKEIGTATWRKAREREIQVDGHPHQPLWAQNSNSFPSGNGELGSPQLLMMTFTACKLKQLELLNNSQCWASTEGQGFRKRINLWSPTWSAASTEYHFSSSKPQHAIALLFQLSYLARTWNRRVFLILVHGWQQLRHPLHSSTFHIHVHILSIFLGPEFSKCTPRDTSERHSSPEYLPL